MRLETLETWTAPTRLSGKDLTAAWEAYRRTAGSAARNVLMEHYLPLVKYYCQWYHYRLPKEVDLDDVIGAGVEGLRCAIGAYDCDLGVKFETYCCSRIRWAILDFLRSIDRVPRLMRRMASHLSQCREELVSELRRTPTDEELAAYMGLRDTEFHDFAARVRLTRVVSLDRGRGDGQGDAVRYQTDALADTKTESPMGRPQREALKELVTQGLSAQERMALILYYYEELTMREIGAALDVSESRISQILSAVLTRLGDTLRGREAEFLEMGQ